MYCTQCGCPIPQGAAFCRHCGSAQLDTAALGPRELAFPDFFSGVFVRHTMDEAERVFVAGTSRTTPPASVAARTWQRPWLYSRVLLVLLCSFAVCALTWGLFENANMLPAILVLGSFSVPVSALVFLFEANVGQDVSFLESLIHFLLGGVLSLFVAMPLHEVMPASGTQGLLGALTTGVAEELAKLLVIVVLIGCRRRPLGLLGGILLGGAVGAGFAAFESAGYAFRDLMLESMSASQIEGYGMAYDVPSAVEFFRQYVRVYGYQQMMGTIAVRGVLAVGTHLAWSAIAGAAASTAVQGGRLRPARLLAPRCVGLLAVAVALHGLWDWAPLMRLGLTIPATGIGFEHLLLVAGVWVVLLGLMRRGMAEVAAS